MAEANTDQNKALEDIAILVAEESDLIAAGTQSQRLDDVQVALDQVDDVLRRRRSTLLQPGL